MTPEEAQDRIEHSRQMVSDWFAVGGPEGPIDVLLGICADSIAMLEQIEADHPTLASAVVPVLKDWKDMEALTRERLDEAKTPEAADQRIILSRQTLYRYAEMTRAQEWPIADLQIIADEITLLEQIALDHPVKAEKVFRLAESWGALMDAVRGKMN